MKIMKQNKTEMIGGVEVEGGRYYEKEGKETFAYIRRGSLRSQNLTCSYPFTGAGMMQLMIRVNAEIKDNCKCTITPKIKGGLNIDSGNI